MSELVEILIAGKEIIDSFSDLMVEAMPDNFCDVLNELAFLNADFLGIASNGTLQGKLQDVAYAIKNLSNLLIWGILLFVGFKCVFSYFISKKEEVPWRFFVRMIIFGILANSSIFICYTGVFLTENCTEYIREYSGKNNISFSFLEEYFEKTDELNEEENMDIYTFDALVSSFIYFSSFFTAICLGARFILIKSLILLSPLFFIAGGSKSSEKIFFKWCKIFFSLIFLQIIFCAVLGVTKFAIKGDDLISSVLVCGILLVFCKNIISFLKLSY